jgi:hypothetical protein
MGNCFFILFLDFTVLGFFGTHSLDPLTRSRLTIGPERHGAGLHGDAACLAVPIGEARKQTA